ncbi:MAG: aspartate-semialdehyde dehydrogenase [Spirochaetales bacterium]|jgi:aspartate-semialdehyde dehydrogenase|nr:aspartate-semialdehyde dehydrogenase [Spirochaetales bacterium]
MDRYKVAVIGVGMVGEQIISILRERDLPIEWPPKVYATRERTETLAGEQFLVEEVSEDSFKDADVVLFAGKEGAKGASVQWRACAEAAGALCIDNSSDFRMDLGVPLVVPEVNLDAVELHHRFIASPNCSTIQMVMTLAPLHRAATVKRVVVSTYQSVSGWGVRANEELYDQIPHALGSLDNIPFDPTVMARPIAFNLLPHIDRFTDNGYTKEEMKMVLETQKIIGDNNVGINATTVRVPVSVGHGESINIETEEKLAVHEVRKILEDAPGLIVLDDLHPENPRNDASERTYPTVEELRKPEYRDSVLVGRIREDSTVANGISLWCIADNLRKGAALNVVQIWEGLLARGGS